MSLREATIGELEKDGCIRAIQDGNHGEKHPKATDYVEEGIPFIMASDIRHGRVDIEGANKLPQEITDRLRIGFCEGGDVLLSHKGSVGYVAIAPEHDPYLMLTPQVTYYRVDENRLLPEFLSYAFRDPQFQKRLVSTAGQQGTRGYVGIRAQRQLKVWFADLSVQRSLVDAIQPYDDLIENNRRRMALLEEAARQLYREWFVRLRFPGHEHTRIIDGVPEGWERKSAYDALEILSGGTPKTTVSDYWGGDIRFYTPKDAVDGVWVTDAERSITEQGLANCNSKLYPRETVFISARGTVGKLNMAQRPMAMSQSCYALVGKLELGQPFVFFAMQAAVEALKQQAVGAVFDAIIVETFKRIHILIPDAKLLRLFDESFRPVLHQIENLTIQSQKLRAARDLLLPRLMSGEIAV